MKRLSVMARCWLRLTMDRRVREFEHDGERASGTYLMVMARPLCESSGLLYRYIEREIVVAVAIVREERISRWDGIMAIGIIE